MTLRTSLPHERAFSDRTLAVLRHLLARVGFGDGHLVTSSARRDGFLGHHPDRSAMSRAECVERYIKEHGFSIEISRIDPAFAQPGGGLQVHVFGADGNAVRVPDLVEADPASGRSALMTREAFIR